MVKQGGEYVSIDGKDYQNFCFWKGRDYGIPYGLKDTSRERKINWIKWRIGQNKRDFYDRKRAAATAKRQADNARSAKRRYAATKLQALWKGYNTRKTTKYYPGTQRDWNLHKKNFQLQYGFRPKNYIK